MPCQGTYTCIGGDTYDCTGNTSWQCAQNSCNGWTSNNCYWVDEGSGCDYTSCCNYMFPGGDVIVGPCTANCWAPCYDCCGGDQPSESSPPPCGCYTITTTQVTSGTGNPGSLGDCRSCEGTSGTTTCRNMCDNHCGSNYGTPYSSQECLDNNDNVRGDNGVVYPNRSYYNCAGNACWEHNACNCDCLTPVTETVEVVNGPFVGCTDPLACNYDSSALCDNDSCEYGCYGCMNPGAVNYDPSATIDDGSCEYYTADCIDPAALNCDPQCSACNQGGTFDCESLAQCQYPIVGCTDESADNYDPNADTTCTGNNGGISCDTPGENCCCSYPPDEDEKPIPGCTDIEALNYNPNATYDNGSCFYIEDSYLCEGEVSCGDYYFDQSECPPPCVFLGGDDQETWGGPGPYVNPFLLIIPPYTNLKAFPAHTAEACEIGGGQWVGSSPDDWTGTCVGGRFASYTDTELTEQQNCTGYWNNNNCSCINHQVSEEEVVSMLQGNPMASCGKFGNPPPVPSYIILAENQSDCFTDEVLQYVPDMYWIPLNITLPQGNSIYYYETLIEGVCVGSHVPQVIIPPQESRNECIGTLNCFSDIYVPNIGYCPEHLGCEEYYGGGCTDNYAYNYDNDVEFDDGSCIYKPDCPDADCGIESDINNSYVTTCQVFTLDGQNWLCRNPGWDLPHYPWDIILSPTADIIDEEGNSYVPDWSQYVGQYINLYYTSVTMWQYVGMDIFGQVIDVWTIPFTHWDVPELISGCTNQYAYNYNSSAEVDDGSCLYYMEDEGYGAEARLFLNVDSIFGDNFRENLPGDFGEYQEFSDQLIQIKFDNLYQVESSSPRRYNWDDIISPTREGLFNLHYYYSPQEFHSIIKDKDIGSKLNLMHRLYKTELGLQHKKITSSPNRRDSENWIDDDGEEQSRNDCPTEYVESTVLINEVMHSPRRFTKEYIELYNSSGSDVDISGWRFTRGIKFTFPDDTIIPADSYVVVGRPQFGECTEDEPWTCEVFCCASNPNGDYNNCEGVDLDTEGTCHYFNQAGDEMEHPQTGTPCASDTPCEVQIDYQYVNSPQADIFYNPDDYGAELGVNLFEWDKVYSSGRMVLLSDMGEDILLENADGENIDCVDYKGWTPDVVQPHDMKYWPLVKAGIFGGHSIEKYKEFDHVPTDGNQSLMWYASRNFVNVFAGFDTNRFYDDGTPLSSSDLISRLGQYTQPQNKIDLTDWPEGEEEAPWLTRLYPDGEFLFSIASTTFVGFVESCDGTPCVRGSWYSQVPGHGISQVTGTFKLVFLVNPFSDVPDAEDDCGIIDGNNDCSLCNEQNGYQCDNCACSGCTDIEALNYGVLRYGECILRNVGSGNCNTLVNMCGGNYPDGGHECYDDDDCTYERYTCDYPDYNENNSGYSCNGVCPDVFGECLPESYGGNGDDDCIEVIDGLEPLYDDGTCQYEVPAAIVDARIVTTNPGQVLQLKLRGDSIVTNSTIDSGFQIQKVKGKLSNLINKTNNKAKNMYLKNKDNPAVRNLLEKPTGGGLLTQSQFNHIDELDTREYIDVAGIQMTYWSTRCLNSFFNPYIVDDEGVVNWTTVKESITTNYSNGHKIAHIVSYYMNDGDDGDMILPLTITDEWTDFMYLPWQSNIFNCHHPNLCDTPGYPSCDEPFAILSDTDGNAVEIIMDDNDVRIPNERCSSGGILPGTIQNIPT